MTDQTSQQPDEIDTLITEAVNAAFDCGEWNEDEKEKYDTYLPLAEKAQVAREKLSAAIAALKHAQQAVESERMSEVNAVTARGLYFDSDQQHELEQDGPTEEDMLVMLADDDQRRRDEIRNKALESAAKICDGVNNYDNPMTARDCADAIRALKGQQPAQADKETP